MPEDYNSYEELSFNNLDGYRREPRHPDTVLSMLRSIYRDIARIQVATRFSNGSNNSHFNHLDREYSRLNRMAEDLIYSSINHSSVIREVASRIFNQELSQALDGEVRMREAMYSTEPPYVMNNEDKKALAATLTGKHSEKKREPKILNRFDILDI